jgi:outer membrane protein
MMFKYTMLIFVLIPFFWLFAQESPIENYIKIGLKSNLGLKQQQFNLQKSMEALNEAYGLMFPSITLQARYSRAGGGREFTIPVGDFVNPVYKSLNDILISQGLGERFPEDVPNQKIPFLREKEHETRLRLIQPLLQPAIWNNYRLKSNLKDIERLKTDIFKRSLIAEIKRGYYNYMKATQVIALYVKIEDLQKENLRVSESLFTSGKATHDVVFRARAELSRTEQEKLNVENLQKQSRSYFNFVLNRPLNSTIEPINPDTFPLLIIPAFESAKHEAFMNREEILQIKNVIAASDNNAAIARSRYFPGINAVVDYGFQGEEYRFTDQDDFWMASVALEWNIFNGLQDKAKLEQAKLETRKMQTKGEELKRQIELEIERIYDNLIVARKTINVTQQQIESTEASFKIVRKKYEEGIAAQVEYLDAQTILTSAAINAIITKYDFFIIYAEFEKITARYQLENSN